jgi:hypothetical protein
MRHTSKKSHKKSKTSETIRGGTPNCFEALERRELLSVTHGGAGHAVRGTGQLYQPMYAKPILPRLSNSAQPAAGQSAPNTAALTPAQVRGAYGMGQYGASNILFGGIQGDGAGQTIAIVDAYDDPNAASDLHTFSLQYGLPDVPSFTKVNQSGATSPLPGTDPVGAGAANGTWEMEESLDIEWAHAMAPQAGIVLVECNSSSSFDLIQNLNYSTPSGGVAWARNAPGISLVSMSFGLGENSTETRYDSWLTTPSGHQGVTFVASTGDNGSPGGFPAYSPNVVAVGGTSLHVSGNSYSSESGWSGSGGGVSTVETQPAYQSGVVTPFSSTKRTIPDVALEADPNTGVAICDSFDYGSKTPWNQGTFGGTSLSAPMMAGIVAIANQGRGLAGQGTLNGATQTLPNIYKMAASNFHDITGGSNGGFSAAGGYDAVTGRGSPMGNQFAFNVAGLSADPSTTNLYLKKDADGVHLDEWVNSSTPGVGTPTQQKVLSYADAFQFNGAAGNDALTLDYTGGDFAAGWTSLTANATSGGSNAINFVGTGNNDGLTINTGNIAVSGGFGSTPIAINNVQNISLTEGTAGGVDSVLVQSSPASGFNINADTPTGAASVQMTVSGTGTSVNFASTQHLASLTIGSGDSVTLASSATNSAKVLYAPVLSIAGTGQLDLTNNQLITGSSAATIRTQIIAKQITTSTLTGGVLGYTDIGGGQTEVRFTLKGDANLDGKVDIGDLGTLSTYFGATSGASWSNGDFDYNGGVDVGDLGALSTNFGSSVT